MGSLRTTTLLFLLLAALACAPASHAVKPPPDPTRDAMMLNFQTVFVSDANCAKSDEEHNTTLGNIYRLFGDVATTDEVISRLC